MAKLTQTNKVDFFDALDYFPAIDRYIKFHTGQPVYTWEELKSSYYVLSFENGENEFFMFSSITPLYGKDLETAYEILFFKQPFISTNETFSMKSIDLLLEIIVNFSHYEWKNFDPNELMCSISQASENEFLKKALLPKLFSKNVSKS